MNLQQFLSDDNAGRKGEWVDPRKCGRGVQVGANVKTKIKTWILGRVAVVMELAAKFQKDWLRGQGGGA